MRCARSLFAALCGVALLFACKSKDDPRTSENTPTAPWPARSAKPSASPSPSEAIRTTYRVDDASRVHVGLKAKEAQPSGTFHGVSGALHLDPNALTGAEGSVTVDLSSIRMDGAGSDDTYSIAARNWLGLGASIPSNERERLRFARFTISTITSSSAPAAYLGRRVPVRTDVETEPPTKERRRVSLTALGHLEVRGLRTTREARLDVDFDYAEPADSSSKPLRIWIRTARPLDVPLAEHDVAPRDEQGRLRASDLPLLGRVVGSTARVDVQLLAVP